MSTRSCAPGRCSTRCASSRRWPSLLVRIGGYAVGVFEGEQLVASKVGTRFVKGRHKKGGSSANRFRRRREEQERELVDAAAEEAARVLGPWRERVEHVALGGDRAAVSRVLASARRPRLAEPLALERFFDVAEPRLRVLEALPYQLYAAKVVEEPPSRQVRDGGAVGGVALAAVDERMLSSSSRTAVRTAPVPRPWITRTRAGRRARRRRRTTAPPRAPPAPAARARRARR